MTSDKNTPAEMENNVSEQVDNASTKNVGAEEAPKEEVTVTSTDKSKKAKKPPFDFNQLLDINEIIRIAKGMNETQWGILVGAIFMLGYGLNEFVLTPPAAPTNTMSAPIQTEGLAETAEEKFKRENANAKLPDGSAISQEVIDTRTQLTQQTPFGDRELEFRVRLPKTWFMSEFARYGLPGEENYAVLTNIARYFGPAIIDTRPYMWVEVERMRRFMPAEAWAHAFMIKRGITPQAFNIISPTEVEALYVDVRELQSYAVRARFIVEGDIMVLVSFGVPVDGYKDYKDMMAVSLNSFQLVRPINRQIEAMKDYRLLNVMNFKYYASWLPKNEWVESTLRPSVELHNPQEMFNEKGNNLQGIILVNVWRKSEQFSHERNMDEIRRRLMRMNMTLREPLSEAEDLPLRSNFTSIKRTPYLAQVDSYVRRDQFDIVKSEESATNQEVWMVVLDNGYYLSYLTLVTPPRGNNYVIWAQNQAALDLLINSLDVRGAPKEIDD